MNLRALQQEPCISQAYNAKRKERLYLAVRPHAKHPSRTSCARLYVTSIRAMSSAAYRYPQLRLSEHVSHTHIKDGIKIRYKRRKKKKGRTPTNETKAWSLLKRAQSLSWSKIPRLLSKQRLIICLLYVSDECSHKPLGQVRIHILHGSEPFFKN